MSLPRDPVCGASLSRISLVYVPSKGVILMIGGSRLWICGGHRLVGIWKFVIASSQWEQMIGPTEFPRFSVSAVLTSDEQRVIIMCGRFRTELGGFGDFGLLQVLDISNEDRFDLWTSTIRCPLETERHLCARSGNRSDARLAAVGWVRELFASKDFVGMATPPPDIVDLIADWCCMICIEMIHWIAGSNAGWKNENHFVLPLTHILPS